MRTFRSAKGYFSYQSITDRYRKEGVRNPEVSLDVRHGEVLWVVGLVVEESIVRESSIDPFLPEGDLHTVLLEYDINWFKSGKCYQ